MSIGTQPEITQLGAPALGPQYEQASETQRLFADTWQHWSGQPGDPGSEAMIRLAWETHAQGYLRTGLAKPEAIHGGLLDEAIDKSRHVQTGITYYLAVNPKDEADRSTARLIDVTSIEELPTYPLTKDGIHPDALEHLEDAIREGKHLRELGALANSAPGLRPGAAECLRTVLGDTIGRNQLLFCSMVVEARDGLSHTLSPANLKAIGDPVALEENQYRKKTTLVPIVIDPDKFIPNLLDAYEREQNPGAKQRYLKSVLFYSAQLPTEFVPEAVLRLRESMEQKLYERNGNGGAMAPAPRTSVSVLADYPHLRKHGQAWTPPEMFDLSDPGDEARFRAAVAAGRVRDEHDPISTLIDDLYKYEHPGEDGRHSVERDAFAQEILSQGDAFGTWVLYPWSGVVSRYAGKETHQALRTSRNRHLVTDEEQRILLGKKVAVIGLSVGSKVLDSLLESGIGGTYILADPDHLDSTNLNRIAAGYTSVGESKVSIAAKKISEKDPWIQVVPFMEGIRGGELDPADLPDVIIEEVDDMAVKALVRLFAERHGIPVVSAADKDHDSVIDVERYDLGDSKAKPFFGRIGRREVEKLSTRVGTLGKWENRDLMKRAAGLGGLSVRFLRSVQEMDTELGGLPQLGMVATRGGADAAGAAREILLGRGPRSGRYKDPLKEVFDTPREDSRFALAKAIVSTLRHVRRAKHAAISR